MVIPKRLRDVVGLSSGDYCYIYTFESLVFLRKAALLLEKGTQQYQEVQQLYDTRCKIAHGAFGQVGPVNLLVRYKQIQRLWRALRP